MRIGAITEFGNFERKDESEEAFASVNRLLGFCVRERAGLDPILAPAGTASKSSDQPKSPHGNTD
jgi:hypothetical protein